MSKSNTLLSGTFGGTGQSASIEVRGAFNVLLSGFGSATVKLERSFDGSAWHVVSKDSAGAEAAYTGNANLICDEPEAGVLYRLNCTAYSSGTIAYRISQ